MTGDIGLCASVTCFRCNSCAEIIVRVNVNCNYDICINFLDHFIVEDQCRSIFFNIYLDDRGGRRFKPLRAWDPPNFLNILYIYHITITLPPPQNV